MKNFKQYLTEFDTPQIYCDMDGVLADFVSFTSKYLGKPFKDEDWLKLPKDMFYQLSPMRDAKLLWEFIGRQDPEPFIVIWMEYLQILYLLLQNIWGNHSQMRIG